MKRAYALIAGAASAVLGCSPASQSQPELCEVAANRPSYAGRTLTVEGTLLVSKHGSAVVDPTCNEGGIPIQSSDDVAQLRELNGAIERALAEPMRITVRVTGKMKRAPHSAMLNEPYWYLALSSAEVLDAQRAQNQN